MTQRLIEVAFPFKQASLDSFGKTALLVALMAATLSSATAQDRPLRKADSQHGKKRATGLASFYSDVFHGQRTTSGQRYDKNALVAAHPRYPIGTIVRVTNLENGRTVRVRIVDRGPTARNRFEGVIIDLSRAAAERLRFVKDGRVRVRTQVLRWGSGKIRGQSPQSPNSEK